MDDIDDLDMELDAPNDNEWNEEMFQERMDNVSNASSKLGALLLQGWTMLAQECPKCCTPMMSLNDSEPRCVVCNPVQQQQSQQNNNNNNNNIITFSQPLRGKKKKKESSQKSSQSAISQMSVQLRQNVKQKQAKLTQIDEENELRQLNELNDRLWNDDDMATDEKYKKSEDASNQIGKLLLQGWTMLAQHCVKCQTPLMSLRGGKPMCCLCDSNINNSTINNSNKPKPHHPTHKIVEEKKEEKKNDNDGNKSSLQPNIGGMFVFCLFFIIVFFC